MSIEPPRDRTASEALGVGVGGVWSVRSGIGRRYCGCSPLYGGVNWPAGPAGQFRTMLALAGKAGGTDWKEVGHALADAPGQLPHSADGVLDQIVEGTENWLPIAHWKEWWALHAAEYGARKNTRSAKKALSVEPRRHGDGDRS